jgi:polysaccharide chain length determinant protein (PEP-CTERM system associated)
VIPGKKYRPEDFLRIFLARKWLFIAPFVTVALTTAMIVYFLPDRFRSRAVVQVVPPRVPGDLIKSANRPNIDVRLQNLIPRILSRSRLESLMTEFNLYPEERRTEVMEDVVDKMNRDIGVYAVRGNAFQVSYDAEDRVTAMRVAARIAQLFIDESYRDREVYAQGTNQFLESQLEETRTKLAEHEKRLAEFRQQHVGELPTQVNSNLTGATNTQMQLQSLNESVGRDRDRLQTLDRELNDLTTQEASLTAAPVSLDADETSGTAAQQLEAARRHLRQMELRLKPEHPDIVRAKRVIADLEQKAEAEALSTPVSAAGRSNPAENARQSRMKDLRDSIATLRTQISRKEQDAQQLRDVLARYQARAEAAPGVETQMIDLNRDYDTLRQLYTNLLRKSQESQMAADMETRQIGEQFRLLEPARAPERPISPNRPQLNLMGVIGGIVLGLAFVALAEYRDTSFKTDDDVLTSLALPVLAMIPNMVTHSERRQRRRRRVMLSVTAVLIALVGAATAVWIAWPRA